jgi:hypothetical protein
VQLYPSADLLPAHLQLSGMEPSTAEGQQGSLLLAALRLHFAGGCWRLLPKADHAT